MKMTAALVLFLGSLLLLQAQEQATQQKPQGPLLNRAASPSEWIITTQAPPSPETAVGSSGPGATKSSVQQAKPRQMIVIKDQDIIYEKTTNENGDVIETWRISDLAITNINGRGCHITHDSGNSFNATDYTKTDFAGFGWISLNNFVGRQSVAGKKCLVFKDRVVTIDPQEIAMMKANMMAQMKPDATSLPSFDINQYKVDVEADIDDQTRLPIMLSYKMDSGTMTRKYDFQPSGQALSIPPEVQQTLKKYKAVQKRMSVRNAPI